MDLLVIVAVTVSPDGMFKDQLAVVGKDKNYRPVQQAFAVDDRKKLSQFAVYILHAPIVYPVHGGDHCRGDLGARRRHLPPRQDHVGIAVRSRAPVGRMKIHVDDIG